MKETKKRTLYECSHARVIGDRIRCRKGYPLMMRTDGDGIDIRRLIDITRGWKLRAEFTPSGFT